MSFIMNLNVFANKVDLDIFERSNPGEKNQLNAIFGYKTDKKNRGYFVNRMVKIYIFR